MYSRLGRAVLAAVLLGTAGTTAASAACRYEIIAREELFTPRPSPHADEVRISTSGQVTRREYRGYQSRLADLRELGAFPDSICRALRASRFDALPRGIHPALSGARSNSYQLTLVHGGWRRTVVLEAPGSRHPGPEKARFLQVWNAVMRAAQTAAPAVAQAQAQVQAMPVPAAPVPKLPPRRTTRIPPPPPPTTTPSPPGTW